MCDFKELEGLQRIKDRRRQLPDDAVCYVCGTPKNETRMRRYNEYCLCAKHFNQLEKYKKIIDPSPVVHRISDEERKCSICGELKFGEVDGVSYCRKHYIQMIRHGEIRATIYDDNEWIDCGDYYECVLKDKNAKECGRTKIDKDDYENLKNYKLYMRSSDSKKYAMFSIKGTSKKVMIHRFIMGLSDDKYTIDQVVDHINGDSLDNRKSNLRICTQHQNSQNSRKNGKVVGVKLIPRYNGYNYSKWTAAICSNYKTIYLGYYDTKAEAILARLKKEKEICGEYGPNKDLYYVLDLSSPIEELNKLYPEEV